ncbi:exosortase-associated EpsI family protein, partial [bacterium]
PNSSASWLGPARKRAFVAAGLLLAVGGALAFSPRPDAVQHDEKWVAAGLPTQVASFRMAPAQDASVPYCSYKMDASTYQILQPWGIVPRVFQNANGESYDVVVIGSNLKDSFHDPAVCFSAQGWNLSNARQEMLATKTYGSVPVTIVDMEREGQKTIAMYFYRLRDGYIASNTGAKKEMFVYKLRRFGKDNEGGFIRIIPNSNANLEKLKLFAAQWVDEAAKTSGGYY